MKKNEIIGKCEWCGQTVSSKYRSILPRFCSHKCSNQWKWDNIRARKAFVTVHCSWCGNPIEIDATDHRIKEGQQHWFCDHKCESNYRISKRRLKICPVCGISFYKRKTQTCGMDCGVKLKQMIAFEKKYEVEFKNYEDFVEKKDGIIEARKKKNLVDMSDTGLLSSDDAYMKEYLRRYNSLTDIKERKRERQRERIKEDELFALKVAIRKNLVQSFRRNGYKKGSRTEEILGCSFLFFKKYIERKFRKGMSWDNYGEWQLDHIVPLATAKNKEEVIRLCHYKNFQPLWAEENLKKSSKIPQVQLSLPI